MPYNLTKRELRAIVVQQNQAGKNNREILNHLSDQNINMRTIRNILKRYHETGNLEDRRKSGRPRTVRTPQMIKSIRERIARNPQRSARKMAKDFGISKNRMQTILKDELGLRAFKKSKIHGLSNAQKVKRFERSKILLDWHAGDEIIFSDEKLFLLQESHNTQNDRVYATSLDNIPTNKRQVQRFQNVSSVMVWGAISRRAKLPLVFIEKGVKINQQYYKDEVLKKFLLPEAKKIYGDDYYCFQQDSAPAHAAKSVQDWCKANLPDFITKDEWPPSSPDLNPLDFCIWGYMLSHLSFKNINSIESFKKAILKVWDEMPMEVVRAACEDFDKRLQVVRRNKGERFELSS